MTAREQMQGAMDDMKKALEAIALMQAARQAKKMARDHAIAVAATVVETLRVLTVAETLAGS